MIVRADDDISPSESYARKQAVNNITAIQQKISEVNDDLFVLEDWISGKRLESLNKVLDSGHLPEDMTKLVEAVKGKVEDMNKQRSEIEEDEKTKFDEYRTKRDNEENLHEKFTAVIPDSDTLLSKNSKKLLKLMVYVQKVHADYRDYNKKKKKVEKDALDAQFKSTFFNDKVRGISNGIKSLTSVAAKSPKKQTPSVVRKAQATTQKKVLDPLDVALTNKKRFQLVEKMRNKNEVNYVAFQKKVEATIVKIKNLMD